MTDFFKHLLTLLKQDKRFIAEDKTFLRNAVYETAMKLDSKLLHFLLSDETTKEKFFADVDGVKIFDKIKFSWAINNRQFLPDSYTRFKNKIGLVDEGNEFISASSKVTLVFPYKDCLLEGGQTKEEQKRTEIFYNETLAPDEVDRLLYPKVLTSTKRYTKDGTENITTFSSEDNLIVKGNNLIVLASLLKRFESKVKCIYIDPPYNTGSDGFNYNNRFNHSTWLVFMKNRLELAKKLLTDDGSIWISIDDDEQAYLKVLCDEIFGRDNFVANVIWEKKYSPQNDATWLSDSHDFILVYAKDKSVWRPNLLPRTEEMDARYSNPDDDPRGVWTSGDLSVKTYNVAYDYPITLPSGRIIYPPKSRCWRCSEEKFVEMVNDNRVWFGEDGNNVPRIKRFLSEVQQGTVCKTIWSAEEVGDNQSSRREVLSLNVDFATPKPERLIERILTLATNAGDLVLDYHLGSGTTVAVAHKMGRKYIGVEQMNYIESLTVERLKKVIGGESGGISQKIGWKGGGSFVYCELAKLNQNFVDEIESASKSNIMDIYKRIIKSPFISYKVNPVDIDSAVEDFGALSLENKKKFLMELLDKNLLYVNYCDIDDEDFAINDTDKEFTRAFYGGD